MGQGLALSAAAHAGLIALALWALPWLRARPGPPVPVVGVSLVTAAELAALAPRPTTPPPPPAVEIAPVPELPLWQPAPGAEEAETPEVYDLAPQFDAAAPLGIEGGATFGLAPPATREPAAPDAGAAWSEPWIDADATHARFAAAVEAAIAGAQIYPRAALARGITGSLDLGVRINRDGRLVEAWVARSAGSVLLDRAGLDAARRARLPAAPAELPGQIFDLEVRLAFGAGR
jgi:protein TonB